MTNQTNVWLSALALMLTLVFAPMAQAGAFAPTRFTVTVEGQGPDVIMIPGLASSADVWRPTADKLKARYRVHLIQVSGFAGTPPRANASGPVLVPLRDEIVAYIRANRLNRPAIVGHSLGGLLALMMADVAGDVTGKLVIVDALPFFGMLMGPTATVESVTPSAAQMRDRIKAMTAADFAVGQAKTMTTLAKSKGAATDAATKASQTSDREVVAQAMYEDFITDMRRNFVTGAGALRVRRDDGVAASSCLWSLSIGLRGDAHEETRADRWHVSLHPDRPARGFRA